MLSLSDLDVIDDIGNYFVRTFIAKRTQVGILLLMFHGWLESDLVENGQMKKESIVLTLT